MSGLSWWHTGFLLWLTDSQVVAQGLSCPAASVAPTSPTRDQTHVHCVARQILNHWTPGKYPYYFFGGSLPLLGNSTY